MTTANCHLTMLGDAVRFNFDPGANGVAIGAALRQIY